MTIPRNRDSPWDASRTGARHLVGFEPHRGPTATVGSMGRITRSAGAAAAGFGASRLLLRRWAANPHPHGAPPVFPPGRNITVPTDDGAEISVGIAGDTGPVVLLVHGITNSRHDWGFVAQRLIESGHQVYGMDQRGHGGSTVGTDGFSAPRFGADVAAVLRRFDLRECVIAGHSMGGIATISFAVDHPEEVAERVKALVLVSTLPRSDRLDQRLGSRAFRLDWTLADRFPFVGRLIAGLAVFGAPRSLAMIDDVLASAGRTSRENRIGAGEGLGTYNAVAELPRISAPTTVACGTADLVTPNFWSRSIARSIPGAARIEWERTGHQSIWERPDEIADIIADRARA